eukprot:TRINITY_DN25581_c0_g1_i3.p1 TRINITY_DN25581_c0_g1~~TRINITY_DN25581_c0_g1_i3.p1  ORF type:complete len:144 (-),score=33.08 TRINITY_DN25581_c0_g1_i3:132-563(-)
MQMECENEFLQVHQGPRKIIEMEVMDHMRQIIRNHTVQSRKESRQSEVASLRSKKFDSRIEEFLQGFEEKLDSHKFDNLTDEEINHIIEDYARECEIRQLIEEIEELERDEYLAEEYQKEEDRLNEHFEELYEEYSRSLNPHM